MADDQKHVREGFRLLLCRERDMELVGEARDGQEAVELAVQHHPDVITMDIKMPRMDGLEATRRICSDGQTSRVLVVAMTWEDGIVRQALDSGALGYIAKPDAFSELPAAIREVYAGHRYFSAALSSWRALDGTSPLQGKDRND